MTGLRQRLRRWWHARLPATDNLALTHRNVYILPTGPGLVLGATLCVLLVASINYQLNLGYLLTFLLAGSALASIHLGHGTLRGLRLSLAPPPPQFAGGDVQLDVTLANPARSARPAIALAVADPGREARWAWCDVPPQDRCTVRVAVPAPRRGRYPLPVLLAETRFPIGAFRVWTVWRPAAQVLVYPSPEPAPPPLPAGESGDDGALAASGAGGDFDGVRAYRRGDPQRLVAWKKAASAGELVSRDTTQARRHRLWLDLAQAGGGDLERRLSRLAAWVLQAEALGLEYGLRLPGASIAPGCGEAHRHRCLEALALC